MVRLFYLSITNLNTGSDKITTLGQTLAIIWLRWSQALWHSLRQWQKTLKLWLILCQGMNYRLHSVRVRVVTVRVVQSKTTQPSTRMYGFLENNFDIALLEIRNSNKGYQQSLKNNTILKNIWKCVWTLKISPRVSIDYMNANYSKQMNGSTLRYPSKLSLNVN